MGMTYALLIDDFAKGISSRMMMNWKSSLLSGTYSRYVDMT